ncbi:MAG TPA: thiol reductant ABC exporter subunit CydC [Gaiellaceae bacterium]|nr:thiol reductant ABC exporter subunit CydC [Gaiellaceae bacterium]
MTTLRRLVGLAGVPAGRLATALLLGVCALAFAVALMTSAGYLISRAAEQPPILSLTVAIVAVRFFGLARPVARYFERLASHDHALRSLGRIRGRFYARIEPLAPTELESFRRGELLGRMVDDVDALQGLFVRALGPPLVALVVAAGCVAVTAVFSPDAAVALAVGLLVGGVAVPALSSLVVGRAARRQAPARAELTAELVEAIRGADELAVYGRRDEIRSRVGRRSRELARLGRRDALATGLGDALAILVAGLTVAAVLAIVITEREAGLLDPVLVATLALLALASFDAVTPLPGAGRELSRTLVSGRRVLDLIDREPTIVDPAEPVPRPPAHAPIELERVIARYPGQPTSALSRLSLRLEPGERVALLGPAGSGKTTVTKLLLRFLDPVAGRVTVAGRDVREYRQSDVRRTFALAGQDSHVFHATIRANLALARPDATEADLWHALDRARLGDWVASLPGGLDTLVGEEGTELSGGERQRLTVARALLADSPVLLLDEPTAHLDAETAEELVRDVFTATRGKTVLLITHRPEGLELADRVLELPAA